VILRTLPYIAAAVTAGALLLTAPAGATKPERAAVDCALKAAPATAPAGAGKAALSGHRAAAAASAATPGPATAKPSASDGNRFDYDSCGCVGG
jgi:hypothetical protein